MKKKFDPVNDYQNTILSKTRLVLKRHDTLLDLGCGRGDNCKYFARSVGSVTGLDITPHPEWKKNSLPNLKFVRGRGEKLPFKDRSFDVVFTKDTLHHVEDIEQVLKEMKRVTKKRGLIYIVESNRYNPVFYIHMTRMLGHQHFTRGKFMDIVLSQFNLVRFRWAESRVYPIPSASLHRLIHFAETILESVPVVNSFTTYNIAEIINK